MGGAGLRSAIMLMVAQALGVLFIGGAFLLAAWILFMGSVLTAVEWARGVLKRIMASLRA